MRGVAVTALGLCLAAYLVLHIGLEPVLSAAAAVGWGGFALICLYTVALFPVLGAAWSALMPGVRSALWVFTWARMVREAASDVLPFSQVGGILLGARTAMRQGVPAPAAFASTIVDVTTEVLAQIPYIALGVAILCVHARRSPTTASAAPAALAGLVLLIVAGASLLVLQRYGSRLMSRIASRLLPRTAASAHAVADVLDDLYRARARVLLSSALHLGGWIASAGGTWLAFRLTGQPIEPAAAIAIESLVCAARSLAAFVPNALGVQEAGYAALAPLFGIPAEFGLAVSLLKRARDVAIGGPILLLSQGMVGRRALGGA